MSIYFGNDMVNVLYIGLTPVTKGYVGTHLFYNGDNTIIDLTYEKYILNTKYSTLYNTEEAPVKSAILKGNTLVNIKGMQSVKTPVITTTGKNLFNTETVTKGCTLSGETGLETSNPKRYISDFIYVKGITHLAITNPGRTQNVWGYDENKQPIKKITNSTTYGDFVISVPSDISYIRLPVSTNNQDVITDTIIQNNLLQVEAGQQFTTYEPFKTNILTVNEPVKLLGIGEVKDELDLLTGELTQRIGDITFDGSENWKLLASNSNDYRTVFVISRGNIPTAANIVCAEYLSYSKIQGAEEYGYIYVGGSNLNIVEEANMSLDAFKSKLQSNPLNIQYLLPSESVKTVNLSVINQDGNITKLSTFNDITHVELSSDGMIPEAELEVATKNEEVLNTMSLEMDGISTTQTTLEETSNIQSENVDSTLIATTEIYEQLL